MQESNRIHTIFNSISNDYDLMNDVISFNQHNIWRNKTNKQIFLHEGDSVLDLCCGTGDWTLQLSKMCKGAQITGIDFSENMLDIAKVKGESQSNIEWIHGDVMNLPFEDNTFEYVTIGFGLRNLPDYGAAIKEVYRVLKPGGTFVILETSNPDNQLFKFGFNIYFGKIMPFVSNIIIDKKQEYEWLYESTHHFLSKFELSELLKVQDFTQIKVINHTFGAAATHFAIKPI